MQVDAHQVHALHRDLAATPARVEADAVDVVDEITTQTQHDAQEFAPVLTGYLRAHIRAIAAGLTGRVVSEADYGGYVEDGTSDTPAQPYMAPAAELNAGRLAEGLGDVGERIL